MIIAFTIGHTRSYDQGLLENPQLTKLGKTEDYNGGWVWKNVEEAWSFIWSQDFLKVDWGDGKPRNPENFSVFGLMFSSWEEDTYLINDQIHLLHDAQLFRLEELV